MGRVWVYLYTHGFVFGGTHTHTHPSSSTSRPVQTAGRTASDGLSAAPAARRGARRRASSAKRPASRVWLPWNCRAGPAVENQEPTQTIHVWNILEYVLDMYNTIENDYY